MLAVAANFLSPQQILSLRVLTNEILSILVNSRTFVIFTSFKDPQSRPGSLFVQIRIHFCPQNTRLAVSSYGIKLTWLLLLQDGGLQETAVLHAGSFDEQEEDRSVERRQPVPQADRVHRAEGHEQRLMIARRLDDRFA